MAIRKSSNSGIPFGNTAGRPASASTGQPYFNGELQRLELYTGAQYGWQNIVAETPGVTGYTGTVAETNSTNTITITGTNFAVGATATLVGQDGTEYIASSTTINNLTSITAVFGVLPQNNEPYDIKVTNPSNLYGVYYDILTVNDKPAWLTAAGSLGSFPEQTAFSTSALSVSDEENNTITYSLASGSTLPSGVSLNSSTGVLSGTLPDIASDTTYTFTINASDGVNTSQPRTFSITSLAEISAEYLLVAGGGAGGTDQGGGGGAGGYLSGTYSLIRGASYSVTVGSGGVASGSAGRGGNGGDSTAFSLTAVGGGGGGGLGNPNGATGGSGGGGAARWSYGSEGSGASPTSGQGNAGARGSNVSTSSGGGGGGGAGSAGSQAQDLVTGNAGDGGAGLQSSITGTALWYAGGGGGGVYGNGSTSVLPGNGGSGVGGKGLGPGGGTPSNYSIHNGAANTGSGGGGGLGSGGVAGGAGGSGVIVISYPNTFPAATVTGTYDTPTRSGYRVYRFTAGSGTITI